MARVAVVLAGCGHRDGAEVREAVFTLLALDEADATVACFAPDVEQMDIINHHTGKAMPGTRNVLVEAARIARGAIEPLDQFDAEQFDALIFPGGTGAAKNLSDFVLRGADAVVRGDVRDAVEAMQGLGKPIGFVCITPACVGALVLGSQGASLTVGADADPVAATMKQLGSVHQPCAVGDCIVDEKLRVVSTPAYMDGGARIKDVRAGIKKLVDEVLGMC